MQKTQGRLEMKLSQGTHSTYGENSFYKDQSPTSHDRVNCVALKQWGIKVLQQFRGSSVLLHAIVDSKAARIPKSSRAE